MDRFKSHAALAGLLAALFVGFPANSATAKEGDREEETGPLAEELDNYWSVDRDLPVIQDKLYERKGRFGVGLYAGLMSSEPFYWYLPVGGRLSYFFSDHAGIEVGGQYLGGSGQDAGPLANETEITGFFRDRVGESFDPTTDLEDRFMWRANASIAWHPLYGKWSFLNNKLSHLDFNLVLGGGAVSVVRPNFERTESSVVVTPEVVFGGGVHFFLSQHLTLRADGRFYAYQGADIPSTRSGYDAQEQDLTALGENPNFFKRIQVPSEFLLGVTYLF